MTGRDARASPYGTHAPAQLEQDYDECYGKRGHDAVADGADARERKLPHSKTRRCANCHCFGEFAFQCTSAPVECTLAGDEGYCGNDCQHEHAMYLSAFDGEERAAHAAYWLAPRRRLNMVADPLRIFFGPLHTHPRNAKTKEERATSAPPVAAAPLVVPPAVPPVVPRLPSGGKRVLSRRAGAPPSLPATAPV